MKFTAHPDGSVSVEADDGRRVVWPSMEELRKAEAAVAGGDFCAEAAREALILSETVKAEGGDPADAAALEAKSEEKEAAKPEEVKL